MMLSLTGRHILITGASRGLGAVCARAFAAQGARLTLMARSAEALEAVAASCAEAGLHRSIPVDLLEMSQIATAVDQLLQSDSCPDTVLHCAGGGLGLREPLLPAEGLQLLFSLNVAAPAEINRLLLPVMQERAKGNLVHVGSIAGSEAVASVGYNTAKAALAAYVRSLGNEMAASGIIVTGILPGGFRAPGNSWERLAADKPDVVEQFVQQRLPRGYLAQAEELIPLLAFLCSDAASMMGGCMIPIDAGEGKAYAT